MADESSAWLSASFKFYQEALRGFSVEGNAQRLSYLDAIRKCRDCWEGIGRWLVAVERNKKKTRNPILLGESARGMKRRDGEGWLPNIEYWKAVFEGSTVLPDLRNYLRFPQIQKVAELCNRAHHGTSNMDLNQPEVARFVMLCTYRVMALVADRIGFNGQLPPPAGEAAIVVRPSYGPGCPEPK